MTHATTDFTDPEVQVGVRIRAGNQLRDLGKAGEPHEVVEWLMKQNKVVEQQIQLSLDVYSRNHPIGEWMRTITGIGPVIAAGFLANVRWEKPDGQRYETAGTLWRLAGLDPSVTWKKGEKRPWNASLKTLCWKAGDSFVKFSGNETCFYGHLYRARKALEEEKNLTGAFAAVAETTLQTRKFKDAKTKKIYEAGRLPPGRLDLRARRFAVKIFLSHFFMVGYEITFGEKPAAPYAMAIQGHADYMRPPNWPMRGDAGVAMTEEPEPDPKDLESDWRE